MLPAWPQPSGPVVYVLCWLSSLLRWPGEDQQQACRGAARPEHLQPVLLPGAGPSGTQGVLQAMRVQVYGMSCVEVSMLLTYKNHAWCQHRVTWS